MSIITTIFNATSKHSNIAIAFLTEANLSIIVETYSSLVDANGNFDMKELSVIVNAKGVLISMGNLRILEEVATKALSVPEAEVVLSAPEVVLSAPEVTEDAAETEVAEILNILNTKAAELPKLYLTVEDKANGMTIEDLVEMSNGQLYIPEGYAEQEAANLAEARAYLATLGDVSSDGSLLGQAAEAAQLQLVGSVELF